ncbi:hypothetical protein [Corynebacterium pygosceleis]|uniref:Uncharacterized protein n=1 Tax=Corynebacterium pygosceleis TaxID=2800406 RepID=A0A9Q4C798_9CORY|nr:hypothetical protein [Corynebacterium pygosceleis]MCK7636675.1 hypothetical protein [Corynebacterium pygosceleis]MCK7674162.1 hypothetical protein [Corynebacterium pygosceleis]MCL0120536.1 hypothetical protein [Corynebacterium pygosceleis]MCX7444087.1 hypothetical protein [Corynebacterium pygosceleis]MCX7467428.1 hypothetical protein [Corynebacterium pygosceleis]
MSIEKYPRNPIEQRKQAVRRHARAGVVCVGGGVVGGVVLALVASSWFWLILGLVIAVAGGVYNWRRIQAITGHRDDY